MKECEFKKECEKHFQMDICAYKKFEGLNDYDKCGVRKFAIIVRNQTIEDAIEIWPGTLKGLKALKMKESP